MANDTLSSSTLAGAVHTDPAAPAAPAAPSDESSTKGILRDAIHKVMEEIEYHEREAKKHTQKAGELRKDLRESFAFLQEKKGDAKPAKAAEESRPDKSGDVAAKAKVKDAADEKSARPAAKKEPPSAKARKK